MNILKEIEKYGLKIAVLLYCLGFFINTVYLMQFKFVEFDLLQTRYIYTGIVPLLLFSGIVIFAFIRLNIDEMRDNFKSTNLLNFVYKYTLVCFILSNYLFSSEHYYGAFLAKHFNRNLIISILIFYDAFAAFYIWGVFYLAIGMSNPFWEKIAKRLKPVYGIIALPSIAFIVYVSWSNKELSYINYFVVIPFFIVLFFMSSALDAKKGISFIGEPVITKNEDTRKKYDNYFIVLSRFLLILIMSYIYALNIYPRLPSNLGGAQPIHATLITKTDSLKAQIIYENSNYFLVKLADSIYTHRIQKSMIQQVIVERDK